MTISQFETEHLNPNSKCHPMNVLDFKLGNSDLRNELPDVVTKKLSLGHIIMDNSELYDNLSNKQREKIDLVKGVSKYALCSEMDCQTNFHQDFSATSVMYVMLFGKKTFFVIPPSTNNNKELKKWDESGILKE